MSLIYLQEKWMTNVWGFVWAIITKDISIDNKFNVNMEN